MALTPHCISQHGTGPIIAAAVHNGHDTQKNFERHLAIDEREQLCEADPITGEWMQIAKTQIVRLRSRLEVDLNRPRDKAVDETPADAGAMKV